MSRSPFSKRALEIDQSALAAATFANDRKKSSSTRRKKPNPDVDFNESTQGTFACDFDPLKTDAVREDIPWGIDPTERRLSQGGMQSLQPE